MKWTLTPDEFIHVWRETGVDGYPLPLSIVSAARTKDVAAKLDSAAALRYPAHNDPDLDAALLISAKPSTQIRILAGNVKLVGSALNGSGAVLVQRGSEIDLRLVRATTLPTALSAFVPHVDAGRGPALSTTAAELDGTGPLEIRRDAFAHSSSKPIREFLRATRSGEGHVEVQYRIDTPHPTKPRHFGWIDIYQDGRHLVHAGTTIDITPLSKDRLRAEFARLLG